MNKKIKMNEDEVLGVTSVVINTPKDEDNLNKYIVVKESDTHIRVLSVIAKVTDDFRDIFSRPSTKINDSLQFRNKVVYINKGGKAYIKIDGRQKVLGKDTQKKMSKQIKKLKRIYKKG